MFVCKRVISQALLTGRTRVFYSVTSALALIKGNGCKNKNGRVSRKIVVIMSRLNDERTKLPK